MLKQVKITTIVIVLASLFGCASSHTQTTEQITSESSINEIDFSDISLPSVHVISPSTHPHFLYMLENTGVFESVHNGYIDEGLEIRIQRQVDLKNKGGAVASLLVSAATLFVVPAYENAEDLHQFSIYYDGIHQVDFTYSNTRDNYISLFKAESIQAEEAMMEVDKHIVDIFIRDFYASDYISDNGDFVQNKKAAD
jgi:hypothetical protein